MSLWADKYKPKTLDQLSYHKDLSNHLKKLAHSDNFPHMLFYGPSGAGKKTRITAVLREIYGPSVDKLKVDQRQFISTSNRKMLFTVVSSNFHLELNPSDLGMYDRVIVQDVIKSIAQSQQIDPNARHQFKVVIIDQADELTREAQAALRRTMEKYTSTMRLILCCNSLSRIIAPVRSRCLLMRVGRPEVPEVVRVLQDVSSKEGFELPSELASKIAEHAERNLRAAMLSLESTAVKHSDLTTITQPESLDWEMAIARVAKLILEEQSPARLLTVRSHLYDIITKCIQSSIIIKRLAFYLTRNMDEEMKLKVIERAAFHEHRLRLGAKDIFHLEAFVANVMSMYKRHLNQM
ncbi:P-loop containing nucleoside triphosphate hydrolase protein [Thamnidium elegans]|nr:P-loop containing nucleoside triphosphate hydrolase protein [Thamnidium elegans]